MGLYGTIAIERNIFGESRNFRKCNCTAACLTSIGDDIHSHKKHISLQILHWTHNDVVVQCSFTCVCQGVPNMMLGASYTNRDVSSFQTRDLYCNGRNMYVQLAHLLFVLEMFRWYVVLDKFVSYSRRQWTSFFHNLKLELYSFCEPCPYIVWSQNATNAKAKKSCYLREKIDYRPANTIPLPFVCKMWCTRVYHILQTNGSGIVFACL